MSDYRRQFDPFNLAIENLQEGQDRNLGAMERNEQYMQDQRGRAQGNIEGLIQEARAAAATLDPNNPEDAAVLATLQQEIESLTQQATQGTSEQAYAGSLQGSPGVTRIQQQATLAGQRRADEEAARDIQGEVQLINTRAGHELNIANVNNAAREALQQGQLEFTGDQAALDRVFEGAQALLSRLHQSSENERNRQLERYMQREGFEFQTEEGERNRIVDRTRLEIERDLGERSLSLQEQELNRQGRQEELRLLTIDVEAIRSTTDPEAKARLLEQFESDLLGARGLLTDYDVRTLVRQARMDPTAADRLLSAQADTQEAVAAGTREDVFGKRFENLNEQATALQEAADAGDMYRVRTLLAQAETILGDPTRYSPEIVNAAQEAVDMREDLMTRAETNRTTADETRDLLVQEIRNRVRSGDIDLATARNEFAGQLANRFEDEDEMLEWARGEMQENAWNDLFGGREVGEATLLMEFRAQKRAEREGIDAQIGASLLAAPDVDNPDAWIAQVVDMFSRDTLWGPGYEAELESLARSALRGAEMEQNTAFAEIARLNATAAELLSRAGMHEAQGEAALMEAEAGPIMALLENLGDITGLFGERYKAAKAIMDTACGVGDNLADRESPGCIEAQEAMENVSDATVNLYNMVLRSLGIEDATGGAVYSPEQAREAWQDAKDQGVSAVDAMNGNMMVVAMYPDDFLEIYPEANEPALYGPMPDPNGNTGDAPDGFLGFLARGISSSFLQAGETVANVGQSINPVGDIFGFEIPYIDITPHDNQFESPGLNEEGFVSPMDFLKQNPRPQPTPRESETEGD